MQYFNIYNNNLVPLQHQDATTYLHQDVWAKNTPYCTQHASHKCSFLTDGLYVFLVHLFILALESRVNENLQQLQQDCFRLENMARKEVPTRRQNAKL